MIILLHVKPSSRLKIKIQNDQFWMIVQRNLKHLMQMSYLCILIIYILERNHSLRILFFIHFLWLFSRLFLFWMWRQLEQWVFPKFTLEHWRARITLFFGTVLACYCCLHILLFTSSSANLTFQVGHFCSSITLFIILV